jgi:hypothetical protein
VSAGGYIKVHRQVMENEFYFSERFTKMQAWFDLLLLARHSEKPATVSIRGNMVEVKRGQLCYSMVSLARRWKWNRRTVLSFLSHLENREMIHHRKSNITSVITVLKWEEYQGSAQQSAQQTHNRVHTNKNGMKGSMKSGTHGEQLDEQKSPSEVHHFVTFFCEKHATLRGSPYMVQSGKDHAAAAAMLGTFKLEECKARAVRYLSRRDKWTDEHGCTISNMAVVVNSLTETTHGGAGKSEIQFLDQVNA